MAALSVPYSVSYECTARDGWSSLHRSWSKSSSWGVTVEVADGAPVSDVEAAVLSKQQPSWYAGMNTKPGNCTSSVTLDPAWLAKYNKR